MSESNEQSNRFPVDIEQRMVSHMNADHVDAMRDYCRHANVDAGKNDPKMTSIDQNGFNLDVNGLNIRFEFKTKCKSPDEVRQALVELAETARASSNN